MVKNVFSVPIGITDSQTVHLDGPSLPERGQTCVLLSLPPSATDFQRLYPHEQ